eukprot:12437268-Alexandrium_andersonii.AAC.1
MNDDWPSPGVLPRALGRDAVHAAVAQGEDLAPPTPSWVAIGCPVGEWTGQVAAGGRLVLASAAGGAVRVSLGPERVEFLLLSPAW